MNEGPKKPTPGVVNWEQPREYTAVEKAAEEKRRAELAKITVSGAQKPTVPSASRQSAGAERATSNEGRDKASELVMRDGGIKIHLSVDKDISPKGWAGFQNLETRLTVSDQQPLKYLGKIEAQLVSMEDRQRGARLDDVLREHGIHELVDIRHDTQPVYEEVIIPGKKGVWGIGATSDRTERRTTGRTEPVMHEQYVRDGKKEPAVQITYYISQREWRDYSGRPGQMMVAEIVLPESTAREVTATINQDPSVIRRIVERAMKEKLLKDPATWEAKQGAGDSLQPPYKFGMPNLVAGKYISKKKEKSPASIPAGFVRYKIGAAWHILRQCEY